MLGFSNKEAGYIAVSVLAAAVYHLHFYYLLKRRPDRISLGITNRLRLAWVEAILVRRDYITAVQTLRNLIMSASFLASTAVLLSLAMLHIAFGDRQLSGLDSVGALFDASDPVLWRIKWLLLAVVLFGGFFNFSLTIRRYSHACLMFGLSPDSEAFADAAHIADTLDWGALHNTLGMRCFYFSVPMTLWLLGPEWLFIGTAAMLAMLVVIDRGV